MAVWKSATAGIALLLLASTAAAQELPKTGAEASGYTRTSSYAEVMAFIAAIQKIDPSIVVETFAISNEKRPLPLVIAGPRGVINPPSAFATNLPIVLVMANIHGGEIEGKEAALMLLRDLVTTHRAMRDDLVILIAPIYNADGNEKISKEHRKTQNGPAEGVGQRENAQGLDLNRDFMKLESPEARGLVSRVLTRWDPLLTVDLHTTNGSYHGYHLTYAPVLNPNADPNLIEFSRATLLREMTERMKKKYGKETYYYGNFLDQLSPEKGWHTFDHRPRYGTNYIGLRNRFAILSEAYSYLEFPKRIEVTYQFVHEALEAVERHGRRMLRIAANAEEMARRGKVETLGVRFEVRPWREDVPILWERATGGTNGNGELTIVRTGEIVPVKTTDYSTFAPVESEPMPWAYTIEPTARRVVDNLRQHGIVVERLNKNTRLKVGQFVVQDAVRTEREFQKHRELTLTGAWREREETLPAGTFLVRTNQPLGRLIFYLLEPRSNDGLFNWNFFDETFGPELAPVRKVEKSVALDTAVVR